MRVDKVSIATHNVKGAKAQQQRFSFLQDTIPNASAIVDKLVAFQVAIPSWALGTGGTRFGRFSEGGEPRNLEEKIEDVGLLHALTGSANAISLHIPWDIPKDAIATKQLEEVKKLMQELRNDMDRIHSSLEKAKAPYSPGRKLQN